MKYYKIVDPSGHNDMTYKEGLNTDPEPFNPSGDCEPGGIYFAQAADILAFLTYGTELYEVEPIGEVYENPGSPKKFKAHALRMTHLGKWEDNLQMLLDEGANVHVDNDYTLRRASEYGHTKVVKLLFKHGADVHARDDQALRWTSVNGHAEVVKLLLNNGADVHARGDYALRWASWYGHTKVVKLLLKHGANVHADNDDALRLASGHRHTEVMELLKSHMKKESK